jgi:hypothetical protein
MCTQVHIWNEASANFNVPALKSTMCECQVIYAFRFLYQSGNRYLIHSNQWWILRYGWYCATIPIKWKKWLPFSIWKARKYVPIFRKLLLLVIHNLYTAPAKRLGWRNTSCHTSPLKSARAPVCVRERESVLFLSSVHLNSLTLLHMICAHSRPRHAPHITARRQVGCLASERQNVTAKYKTWGHAGSLPRHPLEMKDFINCKSVFIMRKQVLCVVVPCGWVLPFRRFEGRRRVHLLSYESLNWLIILKIKAVCFFDTSVGHYPITRRNNPQNMVPQNHSVETSEFSLHVILNTFISVTLCSFFIVSCWCMTDFL